MTAGNQIGSSSIDLSSNLSIGPHDHLLSEEFLKISTLIST